MSTVFDLSKPGVAVMRSTFGGGWAWPLNDAGESALHEFFDEDPAPLAPLGGHVGYIIEPHEAADLAEHLRASGVAWEVKW